MSADVMEQSEQQNSKKRLSASASLDEYEGELDGFDELESQAPLMPSTMSTNNNNFAANGSVMSGNSATNMMPMSVPTSQNQPSQQSQQQILFQNQSQQSAPSQPPPIVSQQPQQSSSVLQNLLQSDPPSSLNSPRTTYPSFSTKSPMPNSMGQSIMSPMNASLGIQPSSVPTTQRNMSMRPGPQSSNMAAHPSVYEASNMQPQSQGPMSVPMNPQTPYGSTNFSHPQHVRMFNQQGTMRSAAASRNAYNTPMGGPAMNPRQIRHQQNIVVQQNSQQTPGQVRQMVVPLNPGGGMGASHQYDYQIIPVSSAQMNGNQRQSMPQEIYTMTSNSTTGGQMIHQPSAHHHLQNAASMQHTQGVMQGTPINQPGHQRVAQGGGLGSMQHSGQILQASVMGQPQSISANQSHAQSHQIQSQQPTQTLMNGNVPVQPPLMLQKIQPSSTPQQPQQSTQYLMPNVNLDPRTHPMNVHQSLQGSAGPPTGRDQLNSFSGTGGSNDPDKKALIQKQLVLLLHAHKCQQREKVELSNGPYKCAVDHCDTMKNVLQHMTNCAGGGRESSRQCEFPHCASSRQIILHWKNCKQEDCPVCTPVRSFKIDDPRPTQQTKGFLSVSDPSSISAVTIDPQQQMPMQAGVKPVMYQTNPITPRNASVNQFGSPPPAAVNANTLLNDYNPPNPFRSSNPPNKVGQFHNQFQGFPQTDIPVPDNPAVQKDWHHAITNDLRQHLIAKLVKAIFPSPDPAAIKDQRIKDLISYAKKVEKEMFEHANDKEEYYQLLAEKIYKIQKELQEKKNKRLTEQSRNAENSSYSGDISSRQTIDSGYPSIRPLSGIQNSSSMYNSSDVYSLTSQQPQPISGIKRELKIEAASMEHFLETENNSIDQSTKRRRLEESCSALPSTSGIDQSIKQEPTSEQPSTSKRSLSPKEMKDDIVPEPKVFDANELRGYLKPILERLESSEDAAFFREPVDTVLHCAPNYYEIIKKPMDLQTIGKKLDQGKYSNPWEFIEDMHLIFDNASTYNRKNSRPYKCSLKLFEKFQLEIDPVMKQMGYCCGERLHFTHLSLLCYGTGKVNCIIPRDQEYYRYEVPSTQYAQYGISGGEVEKYIYCLKCFNELPEEGLNLSENPNDPPNWVPKSKFQLLRNNQIDYEPFEDCRICIRKWHRICATHSKNINPEGFICDNCRKAKNRPKAENRFTAKRLPETSLSRSIEERVNQYIRSKTDKPTEVIIRVLSTSEKEIEVKQFMKQKYGKDGFPDKFPYRSKAIFAFEIIDGVEVCFFGLHVQEYGTNAMAPNSRRVYIAYLDSVQFFQPRDLRTDVYHEILLGYLEYSKKLGYTMAHIWACPPSEGDDYIFHCHPPQQKIPKQKRLQEWYKLMLEKGIEQKIVYGFKDIYRQAIDDALVAPNTLPYFEGDYWPNVIEDCIRDAEKEEIEQRKKEENATNADDDDEDFFQTDDGRPVKKNNNKTSKAKNNLKKSAQKNKKKTGMSTGNKITDKLLGYLEKHKDVFFTIRLFSPEEEEVVKRLPISDPDGLMSSDLMESRDLFLGRSREEHWEFSSLRRAKWSTTNLCYVLHAQEQKDGINCTCDSCGISANYHCVKCEDYDLCEGCYKKIQHEHPMKKITEAKQESSSTDREESIKRCIQSLVHASQCKDANCRKTTCLKMRKVVQHTKVCKQRQNSACPVCKQLIALCCYHSKHCSISNCPVPFCAVIKQKLQEQKRLANRRADFMMRRRMEQLQSGMNASNVSQQHGHQQQQSTSFAAHSQSGYSQLVSESSTPQSASVVADSSMSSMPNNSAMSLPSSIGTISMRTSPNATIPTPKHQLQPQSQQQQPQHQHIRMNGPSVSPFPTKQNIANSPAPNNIQQQMHQVRTGPPSQGSNAYNPSISNANYIHGGHHIPNMNSPSIAPQSGGHQQFARTPSGQLMSPQNVESKYSANSSVMHQRVPPIASPNQHVVMSPQTTGMQMNPQLYGSRDQAPMSQGHSYPPQGISPAPISHQVHTGRQAYPPQTLNTRPSSSQQIQGHPSDHHGSERSFYEIAEKLKAARSTTEQQEIYANLKNKTPNILAAFLKWNSNKGIISEQMMLMQNHQASQHHQQQHQYYHQPDVQQGQQAPLASHHHQQIIGQQQQQNKAQFNQAAQQWVTPQSTQSRFQQRNMGQ